MSAHQSGVRSPDFKLAPVDTVQVLLAAPRSPPGFARLPEQDCPSCCMVAGPTRAATDKGGASAIQERLAREASVTWLLGTHGERLNGPVHLRMQHALELRERTAHTAGPAQAAPGRGGGGGEGGPRHCVQRGLCGHHRRPQQRGARCVRRGRARWARRGRRGRRGGPAGLAPRRVVPGRAGAAQANRGAHCPESLTNVHHISTVRSLAWLQRAPGPSTQSGTRCWPHTFARWVRWRAGASSGGQPLSAPARLRGQLLKTENTRLST